MGKHCAVLGCLTGDPHEVRRRKLHKEKQIVLFKIPESRAREWATAIGATVPLTKKHFVCQLHFKKNDLITHFVNTMPDGTVNYIERDRWALRKDAVPVATVVAEQPIQLVNVISDTAAETSDHFTLQIKNSEEFSDDNTFDSQDRHSMPQCRDYDSKCSNIDSADGSSDEKKEDVKEYSIESLITDLAESQWRRRWAWTRNDNEIVFIYLKSVTLEPRIYFWVNNDLNMTVSLADRTRRIQLNNKIRTFADLLAMLLALEKMRECVGTGRTEETRSTTCSIFVGEDETYERCRSFERCSDCRELRHKLLKRANRPKVADEVKNSRIRTALRLLRRRHTTLEQKVCGLKRKIVELENENRKRKARELHEKLQDPFILRNRIP